MKKWQMWLIVAAAIAYGCQTGDQPVAKPKQAKPEYELRMDCRRNQCTTLVKTAVDEYDSLVVITDTYEIHEWAERWFTKVYPDGHEEPSYADTPGGDTDRLINVYEKKRRIKK